MNTRFKDQIILIGNGTSVLDTPLGPMIDAFDVVVRFNQFKITGFEEYTGTKTNIWWATGSHPPHRDKKFDEVYFFSWWFKKETDEAWLKFITFQPNAIPIVREPLIAELHELFPTYQTPSSGMIATHMFLKKYNKIHLFGFDWWDREEHHYMDKTRRGTLHNPKLEHSWFMNLEKEGKVQFL